MLGFSSRLLGAYWLASSSLADTLEQATDDEEFESTKTVKKLLPTIRTEGN